MREKPAIEKRIPAHRTHIIEGIALIALLALAVVLRFGWSGVSSFAWDEANLSLDALRTIRGGQIALAGQPSSVAIPFFPASVYAFAIPYAFSPDPLVAVGFVAALSTLTVFGVWALGRALFGVPAGLVGALFMAVSPYAVLYGRSIWQPNLLAPLALAWLAAAYFGLRDLPSRRPGQTHQDTTSPLTSSPHPPTALHGEGETSPRPPLYLERGRTIAIAVCVFLGGVVVQVHFAGIPLAVGTLYLLLRGRWWRQWRAVIVGAAAALIVALPYGVFLAQNPAILERYGAVLGGTTRYDLTGFENAAKLALGYGWGFLGGGEGELAAQNPVTAILAGALMVGGLIAVVRRVRPNGDDSAPASGAPLQRASELMLLALLISPLFFIRHSTPILPHYQLVALPAVALTVGAAVTLFGRASGTPRQRIWTVVVIVVSLALAGMWTRQLVTTLDNASIARMPNSALSSILRESRDAANGAAAHGDLVMVLAHGDDPEIDGEVAVFETLLWDRRQRVVNGDVLLILPPEPTTLLATLAPFQAWEELAASGLARAVTEYPRREGALPFVAARYDGVTMPAGFTMLDPLAFADGTTLIGWRARRVGERLRISTLWRAGAALQMGTIQQFHHLQRADAPDGEPLSVSDVPLALHTWRAGDTVVVMADFFAVPPSLYTVDLGHYTLPDVIRIPRVDGGDSVRLIGVEED